MLGADGYATMRSTYDARGNLTGARWYGANGEPVQDKKNGYYGLEEVRRAWQPDRCDHTRFRRKTGFGRGGICNNEIDLRCSGKVTRTSFDGVNGELVLSKDCYHEMRSTYDAGGNVTRQSFHGVNGEPVLHKDGYHAWEARYDEQGNRIEQTSLGKDGKAMTIPGFATMKSTYDEAEKTGASFHGVNGEPVLHEDGYHAWDAQYDKHGNQIAITYLGVDRKPASLPDGYATMKSTYDARDKETRRSYYGANGEPVLSKKDGYHGLAAGTASRATRSLRSILVRTENRCWRYGYATMRSTYDAAGKAIRLTFHGANGKPVKSKKLGCTAWRQRTTSRGSGLL